MEGQQQGQQEVQQQEQQEVQRPLPQEWHQQWQGHWLEWQGQWQDWWLHWQGQWQTQWLQWQQLQLTLQQKCENWQLLWQQQFQQWQTFWDGQWELWRQRCQEEQSQQWWEWPQEQWQSHEWWKQRQQQWLQWQHQGEWQWQQWQQQVQGQELWQLHMQFQQWQTHWQQQWSDWHGEWRQEWRQWQQGQQQRREQWRDQQWRHWQGDERFQEQCRWLRQWLTVNMNFIPVKYALGFKALTAYFVFDDGAGAEIPMAKNTRFGNLIADGCVNEILAAHRQGFSWAGDFSENDLFVSEDERFVVIAKEPKELATNHNQFLDLQGIATWFASRYTENVVLPVPPYFSKFYERVSNLPTCQTERDREISLWVLSDHPFFMGEEKWRAFLEDYYKWYTQVGEGRHNIILRHSASFPLCPNWHFATVCDNHLLREVYWSGRQQMIPDFYDAEGWQVSQEDCEDIYIFRFTEEDGYLAVFQRVFYVHGLEHFGAHWSLQELALYISHIFNYFLPCFIARICNFSHEHQILREALDTYVNRRSASWRDIRERLY